LVYIIGDVVIISMSYMETDANRYKKKRALEKIDREYAKCRSQKTIIQEQKEDFIFKCVMERENKKEALNSSSAAQGFQAMTIFLLSSA